MYARRTLGTLYANGYGVGKVDDVSQEDPREVRCMPGEH